MTKNKIAAYLDLANHQPTATEAEIEEVCRLVKKWGFHAAFVNPVYVSLAKRRLGKAGRVGTVVSFPLGQETPAVKATAAAAAVGEGADELDISMNVGWFKDGFYRRVEEEMRLVVEGVRKIKKETVVKFIIETGFLTDEEIKKAAGLVVASGADFVKTCSGMGPRGARLKDVFLIKEAIGDRAKIKVAGGIKTYSQAAAFIRAGAVQIGTSKAVEIIGGKNEK